MVPIDKGVVVEYTELVLLEGDAHTVEQWATFMVAANWPQKTCIQHEMGRDAGTVHVDEEVSFYLASWKGDRCVRIARNRRV